jgi:hypothetical protein
MKCPKCGYEFNTPDDPVLKVYYENWGCKPATPAEKKVVAKLIEEYTYAWVDRAFEIAAVAKNMKINYVIGILKKKAEKEYIKKTQTEAAEKAKDTVVKKDEKQIGGFDFSEILKKGKSEKPAELPAEETEEEKEARRIKEAKFESELLLSDPKAYREYMDKKKKKDR